MATIDDGSCEPEREPIEGCTDSDAENYDPEMIDDGSCEYEEEPSVEDCSVAIENHYRGHANNDQYSDTMIVAFKVVPTNCDDFIIDVVIELFKHGESHQHITNNTNLQVIVTIMLKLTLKICPLAPGFLRFVQVCKESKRLM